MQTSNNRERILETAEILLRRFGPEKFRIVDVAKALGMSHGNVYRYFPDKEAILDTIAERWLGKITEPLQKIASKGTESASLLEEWLLTLVKLKRKKVTEDPELFRTYHAIAESARGVVEKHIDHLIAQLSVIIRTGNEAGEWNVRDPKKAAEAILTATISFHHPAFISRPGPQPSLAAVRNTLHLLLGGLKSGAL